MTATIRAARWGADDLTVRHGAKLALDGVRLEVPDGRITMVVGGDGAGKTTLLRALAGAVRPSGGGVRRPPALRVGYVSAGPGVYRDLTVDENLAFSGGAYGLRGQRLAGRADELVAATPGAVLDAPARPDGAEARGWASWRRGPRWRLWSADGSGLGAGAERVAPDLEDAVIVASLERRRDAEWKEVAA